MPTYRVIAALSLQRLRWGHRFSLQPELQLKAIFAPRLRVLYPLSSEYLVRTAKIRYEKLMQSLNRSKRVRLTACDFPYSLFIENT